MADPAKVNDQNLLPVQAYFAVDGTFQTFIGQGQPFYAVVDPNQSGLHITSSTIDSTTIGATTPSTGVFTNIATTTGTISTLPSANNDIANKQYVDAYVAGIAWKPPANYGTTADITLSGLATQAGGEWVSSLTAGMRVLVKNQATAADNGIYVASSGPWSRSADANTWDEYVSAVIFIETGATLGGSAWYCPAQPGGTLGVTAINWSYFSVNALYSAGTGLTLNNYVFSITNTGVTANTYGSASSVPVFAVNAQGQLTSVTDTSIAIAASQITSGTINTARISGSYTGITGVGTLTAGTWNASPIGNSYLVNSSLTVNGNTVSLGGSTTVTANTTNALTIDNSGSGAVSGSTFNGSTPVTISYNSVGAPSTSGTNATGTWGISISGNAATATSATSATTATTATNLAGGAAGSVPYQSSAGATAFLAAGTSGQVLSTNGASAPTWIGPSDFLDNITTTQGSLLYRNATSWVNLGPGTAGQVLQTGGASANPSWLNQSSIAAGSATTATSATTSTNLDGGGAGYVPYQSGAGATSFVVAGTSGQVLTSNGTSAPTWTTPTAYATVTDDTTTNATRYPLFAATTAGNLTTEYVSSTKFQFNPSTGILTATSFTGAGTGLTGTASGLSIGGNAANVTGVVAASNGGTGVSTLTGLAYGNGTAAFSAATAAQVVAVINTTAVTNATNAVNIGITDDTTTATSVYPTWVTTTTGNLPAKTASTKLSFVPSTGVLSATSFSGAGTGLTGTASSLSIGGNAATATSATSATTATTATNVAGGAAGSLVYQTASATTSTLALGTSGYVLTAGATAPTYVAQSTLSVGSATTATTATNATNTAITDDTTTNATVYPTWVTANTGNLPQKVTSTKLSFNPSTGALTVSQLIIAP